MGSDKSQLNLRRVKPPCIKLEYEMPVNGAIIKQELPLKIGLMSCDLADGIELKSGDRVIELTDFAVHPSNDFHYVFVDAAAVNPDLIKELLASCSSTLFITYAVEHLSSAQNLLQQICSAYQQQAWFSAVDFSSTDLKAIDILNPAEAIDSTQKLAVALCGFRIVQLAKYQLQYCNQNLSTAREVKDYLLSFLSGLVLLDDAEDLIQASYPLTQLSLDVVLESRMANEGGRSFKDSRRLNLEIDIAFGFSRPQNFKHKFYLQGEY